MTGGASVKKLILIFFAFVLFVFTTNHLSESSKLKNISDAEIKWSTDTPSFEYFDTDTLDKLEALSEHIVLGSFVPREYIYPTKTRTISDFKVENIFKGDTTIGAVIKISEPYYITKERGKYFAVCSAAYFPSDDSSTYLFFLRYNGKNDSYSPCAIENGRYQMPDNNDYNTPLRTAVCQRWGDGCLYDHLCDEVYDKYLP